jgi:hypothetical protein
MVPVVVLRAGHSRKRIARQGAVSTEPRHCTGSAAAWELNRKGQAMRQETCV